MGYNTPKQTVSGTKQKNMSLLPLCMRNPQATAI